MSRENHLEVLGFVDGIEHGQDGTTGITKDMFDAVTKHHLMEDLSARHPDEIIRERWRADGFDGGGGGRFCDGYFLLLLVVVVVVLVLLVVVEFGVGQRGGKARCSGGHRAGSGGGGGRVETPLFVRCS